jgi:hypothetical protein
MKFWHKYHSKKIETPQNTGTSTAELSSLRERLEVARQRAERLAMEALVRIDTA